MGKFNAWVLIRENDSANLSDILNYYSAHGIGNIDGIPSGNRDVPMLPTSYGWENPNELYDDIWPFDDAFTCMTDTRAHDVGHWVDDPRWGRVWLTFGAHLPLINWEASLAYAAYTMWTNIDGPPRWSDDPVTREDVDRLVDVTGYNDLWLWAFRCHD